MSKYLVTGGAGFIGSHIVDSLINQNQEVLIIDDLSSGFESNLNSKADFFKADIRSKECFEKIIEFKPDFVIHTAAQMSVSVSMKDPVLDASINICGLLNILEACRKSGPLPYFVFLSTGGAMYGDIKELPARENMPAISSSIYGRSKRASEIYLDMYNSVYNLKFCSLRLGNVYGPRQNPHGEAGVVAIFIKQILNNKQPKIFGDGTITRDYVYVGDVVLAVQSCVEKKPENIFHIATGKETSVNQIYSNVCLALDSLVKVQYSENRPGDSQQIYLDCSLAKTELSWESTVDIENGIKQTASWFINNGK